MDANSCLAYLIRHGATDSNLADPPILQGRSINGPLSEAGQVQAAAAGACLADRPITAVYSSPLVRAQQTAAAVARPHNLPVRTIDAITEVDVGAWEHRNWVEIEQTENEAYTRFQRDPATHGYRDGENLTDVRDRVMPAVLGAMRDHLGEQIIIVAHNVVNRVLLSEAIQLPLGLARNLKQDNGGINTLRLRNDRLKLVSLNSRLHLK